MSSSSWIKRRKINLKCIICSFFLMIFILYLVVYIQSRIPMRCKSVSVPECDTSSLSERKDYAWAISAFSKDYFEELWVLLYDISVKSNIMNVVILSNSCTESREGEKGTIVGRYREVFPVLNILCHQVDSRCSPGSRCYGADTKLYFFDLYKFGFTKIVSLDADIVILGNSDELFCYQPENDVVYGLDKIREQDWFSDQIINSGVMVLKPNEGISNAIKRLMEDREMRDESVGNGKNKFWLKDCEDQTFFQKMFEKRIMTPYCYPPNYNVRMDGQPKDISLGVNIFHFNVGYCKPWLSSDYLYSKCWRHVPKEGLNLLAMTYWKKKKEEILSSR